MAAKGTASKQIIFNKLKEVFPKAFMESDKIMRIPLEEDGTSIEIKVSLTAAKDLLGNVDDSPKAAAADFNFTGMNIEQLNFSLPQEGGTQEIIIMQELTVVHGIMFLEC